MTIEQRALKLWGPAPSPDMAVWILADGTMLNGCPGGYLRDVDHAEIGQFFTKSKFHDPGSNYLYVMKFIRRGNIRTSCDGSECCFELSGTPTPAQWRSMRRIMSCACRQAKPVRIEYCRTARRDRKAWDRDGYEAHLARYAPGLLAA